MVLYQSVIAIQSNLDYPDFDDSDFFARRLLCGLRVRALVLLLKAKKFALSPLFNAVVLKRIWLWILIMTNKYS